MRISLKAALCGMCASCFLFAAAPAFAQQDEQGEEDQPAREESESPAEQAPVQLDEPFVDPLAGIPGLAQAGAESVEEKAENAQFDFALKELELKFSGKIESNVRVRVEKKTAGAYYTPGTAELPVGIDRNENIFKFKTDVSWGRFAGVADIDFVWLGVPGEIESIGHLTQRNRIEATFFEAHSLFVEGTDLFVEGFDLRVGMQKVLWGVGDQFNPTNNLNPNDVEDVLLFGEQQANLMVKADYSPFAMWTLSGVLVPVFKPAMLPRSAPLGLSATDRIPINESWLRQKLLAERGLMDMNAYPTVANSVVPELPETSLENMQYAFRLAGSVAGHDLALSYYRGFSDVPKPVLNHTRQIDGQICDPDDPESCVDGLLATETTLRFPRIHVLGFNAAGELPLQWISERLHGIGYRFELGVYFPERMSLSMVQDDLNMGGLPVPGGEYDYGLRDGAKPTVVSDEPFAKWVVGLDYSFNEYFYLNLMWVHGLVDEFGAGDFLNPNFVARQGGVVPDDDYLGTVIGDYMMGTKNAGPRYSTEILRPSISDYAVAILDFTFNDKRGLLRLFFMWDLGGYYEDAWDEAQGKRVRKYLSLFDEGFSAIVYPEFNYNFGGGFELGAGALFQLGKNYTKFGDPANGGSLVWTRARFSF